MKISEILSENFQFLVVKFSVYLNRHVFVMSVLIFVLIWIGTSMFHMFSKILDYLRGSSLQNAGASQARGRTLPNL